MRTYIKFSLTLTLCALSGPFLSASETKPTAPADQPITVETVEAEADRLQARAARHKLEEQKMTALYAAQAPVRQHYQRAIASAPDEATREALMAEYQVMARRLAIQAEARRNTMQTETSR